MNIDQIIDTLIKLEADAARQGFYSADFVSAVAALQVMKLDGEDYAAAPLLRSNLCGDPV